METRNKGTAVRTLDKRLADIAAIPWWELCRKKLLLIRPKKPGDTYTEMGSNVWAGEVKTRATALGWDVKDLDANSATRTNIENELNNYRPGLVMHYDHGSDYTMWGQNSGVLEAGIDESNIALAAGRIMSTVSCLTASGLGPDAISKGITSYLGYTDLHIFWTNFPTEFGAAANAANFALLECKTMQEAFDLGWAAYDQLYSDLMAGGHNLEASAALHDRDCFALLGSTNAIACPSCKCHALPLVIHCVTGMPDSVVTCKQALPLHCVQGMPDVLCKYGNPYILCGHGMPDIQVACKGLPFLEACSRSGPVTSICGRGPDGCQAGPPLIIRDVFVDYPDDIVQIDRSKLSKASRKAFDAMLKQMNEEAR